MRVCPTRIDQRPIGGGTRIAAGVFFNVVGDTVHRQTDSITAPCGIPNRFGY